MKAVIARILLRYAAGLLVGWGIWSADLGNILSTDPDITIGVELLVGILIGAVTEGWYYIAKKLGWAT